MGRIGGVMTDITEEAMSPTRPYFVRALYEWIVDNNCTPYLLVDANYPKVAVPTEFVDDGKIVLNLLPSAIRHLHMDNEYVQFSARFGGRSQEIYLPIGALLAIYAKENGKGMFFEAGEIEPPPGPDEGGEDTAAKKPPVVGRPSLTVVK